MSRNEPSPHKSTRDASMRIFVRGPWSDPPERAWNVQTLRSWLEYDSDVDWAQARRRFNGGAALGLVLVVGVCASFWTGVGLIVAHYVR